MLKGTAVSNPVHSLYSVHLEIASGYGLCLESPLKDRLVGKKLYPGSASRTDPANIHLELLSYVSLLGRYVYIYPYIPTCGTLRPFYPWLPSVLTQTEIDTGLSLDILSFD